MPSLGSAATCPKDTWELAEAAAGSRNEKEEEGPQYLCSCGALQKGKPRLRAGTRVNKPALDSSPLTANRCGIRAGLSLTTSEMTLGEGGSWESSETEFLWNKLNVRDRGPRSCEGRGLILPGAHSAGEAGGSPGPLVAICEPLSRLEG